MLRKFTRMDLLRIIHIQPKYAEMQETLQQGRLFGEIARQELYVI